MPALHVRDIPESVVIALRERASRNGHSVQSEIRQILAAAATAAAPHVTPSPIRLTTVRTARTSTWRREDIYDDTGR